MLGFPHRISGSLAEKTYTNKKEEFSDDQLVINYTMSLTKRGNLKRKKISSVLRKGGTRRWYIINHGKGLKVEIFVKIVEVEGGGWGPEKKIGKKRKRNEKE